MDGVHRRPGQGAQARIEVVDGRLDPGGDVDRRVDRPPKRANVRLGHIPHVDKVPGLGPVAEDHRRPPPEDRFRKDRDHAGLGGRVLPRTIHVGIPKHDGPEPVNAPVVAHVLLPEVFVESVRGHREDRVVLADREGAGFAVQRPPGRGKDDLLDPEARGQVEHPQRPQDVRLPIGRRILDRPPEVGLGGVMRDDLRALLAKDLGERGPPDVLLIEGRAPGRPVPAAPHQGVDHRHLMAVCQVGVGDVRTDEPGSPGDEDPHSTVTLLARFLGWSTSWPRRRAT